VFEFVEREKANFPIATACQVLGVSPSGYYAWRRRPPSARELADAALSERIAQVHRDSRETYGSPRIHAELREQGVRCSAKRVARLMRQAGIQGCHRRRPVRTTQRADAGEEVPDLVQRNSTASAPNQLWAADIVRHEAPWTVR
jgi:putative transposase